MATKTYAETPYAATTLHDGDVIIVQQGTDAAPTGYTQMKKTTLEKVKAYAVGTIEDDVDTIGAENAVLKRTVKEQEYRIENLEAMASGQLYTEHTESTSGGVLSLPSSSPLAPWAEVEKVVGKSIIWNQKFQTNAISNTYGDGTRVTVNGTSVSIVGSSASSDEWYELNDRTLALSANHKYIFLAEGFPFRFNIYTPSWSFFRANENVFSPSTDISGAWVYADNVSGNVNLSFSLFLADLTVIFGSGNEPTTVTDGRIAFIKAYAEAHPSYDIGSLHSSTLSKVVSKDSDGETSQSVTLPSLTLKGVGSACDTYNPSTGKVQRKVASVDMGSLTWYDLGSNCFYVDGINLASPCKSNSVLVCSKYPYATAGSNGDIKGGADKTIYMKLNSSNVQITVKDTDYSTPSAFKTAMSGVTLLYELATSTEETSTTIDPYLSVEAGGSVSVQSTGAQAEASVHYLTDLT